MSLSPGARSPGGSLRCFIRSAALLALGMLAIKAPANSQEELTLVQLEASHQLAVDDQELQVAHMRLLTTRFEAASAAFDSAKAIDDREWLDRAFTRIQELSPQLTNQEGLVREKAQEVGDLRTRLLEAHNRRWEELLLQYEETVDSVVLRNLDTEMSNHAVRVRTLRAAAEPVVIVEPVPDLVIRPADDTTQIRAKADMLDMWAARKEEQLAYTTQLLADLRREQSNFRRSQDFRAGIERYGDTRLPVVTTVTQGVPGGDMTYEERIASLESVQALLIVHIEQTKAKAESFRREAGGVWA